MTGNLYDTICAPATITGSGAITVIRVSGADTFAAVDAVVRFRSGSAAQSKGNRIKFGTIHNGDELVDEVLVSIFRAPHSYTGEDSAEISCHASAYIAAEILRLLMENGCRMALPGEFTQRAFVNGKMDLTQAEAVADVIASTTAASHRVAMNQLKGGFSAQLADLRAKLLEMASLMELELDFSEEDVEFADRSRLLGLLDLTLDKVNALASSFRLGNAIKNGVPVAIVGATNAGKSTLLNAILGEQRAIVSDIEGTTRDTIEETFNVGGVLFRFVDTAGIRANDADVIEKIGMERSFQAMKKADVVLVLLDAVTLSNALGNNLALEVTSLDALLDVVDFDAQQVIFVVNKCDLVGKNSDNIFVKLNNKIVYLLENKGIDCKDSNCVPTIIQISAKSGEGVPQLLKILAESQKNKLSGASADSVLVTNMRHYQALVTASESLAAVRSGITLGSPTDLVAEDLRSALSTLGSITGQITHTDVLNNIFANFCIGK